MKKMAILLLLLFLIFSSQSPAQQCGDANNDGIINISDANWINGYLFVGGPPPIGDGDVDQCGDVNISDIVYIYEHVFASGPFPCQGMVDCNIPPGNHTITIDCPTEIWNHDGTPIPIPVYLTSSESLRGFSMGFKFNSDDLTINSLQTTASVIPGTASLYISSFPTENKIVIHWFSATLAEIPPQSNGLLFNLIAEIPAGVDTQTIDIDTTSNFNALPDVSFALTVAGGGTIYPAFSDCGNSDIVLREHDYICGDANNDAKVNVSDAVWIIGYVFVAGSMPPIPYEAGDSNCSGNVDISDAVWIINFVFTNGNDACDADGDGIQDC